MEALLSRTRSTCRPWIFPRTEQILHAVFYWILLNEIEDSIAFDKMSKERQNWNTLAFGYFFQNCNFQLKFLQNSLQIQDRIATFITLTRPLRNCLNLGTLKIFKSFLEYSGFNNRQEKPDFLCKRVHGNKNWDLYALKTFKTSFNIDVQLNLPKPKQIFSLKKGIKRFKSPIYHIADKVYCTAKHNAKNVIDLKIIILTK